METHKLDFSQKSLTLNSQQAEIVLYEPCTNIRVLASAGSGKTTTITARIAHLIQNHGVREDSIFLTTFSRNASDTMKERIDALIGPTRVYAGTFHALANQILRDKDPDRLKDLYHVDELPHKFLEFLSSDKGRNWVGRLHYLIIDEFQDINEIQYDIIRRLHHPGAYLTIVGDDAQNIYTWRGSCVDYILDFHRKVRNVKDFQLSINYRSTEAIVAVANSIMRHIPTLPHKERMTATLTGGEKPEVRYFYRSADERNYIHNKITEIREISPNSTIAILSKFNSVLYAYEETLVRAGMPADMMSSHSEPGQAEPLYTNALPISLCTLHSAKGLEWDHVFLVGLNDDVFPQKKDEESLLQERRLFYVGTTRARKTLTFSYSKGEHNLSRFVREIHRPLLTWFSATQYRLSSNEFEGKSRSLRSAIEALQGEDFRILKEHPTALPVWIKTKSYNEILKPRSLFPIGESWRLPDWVSQKDLQTEWAHFLKAYILRVIGTYRQESGGTTDSVASDVVWTIKIAAEDAMFFDENQSIIERIVRYLFPLAGDPHHTPPHITYQDILEALARLYPTKTWTNQEVIQIVQIIHKIRTTLYNLRFMEYRMDLLRFASIPYSPPQEYRCDLIRAWFKTTQSNKPSISLLPELYLMGGTHTVRQGRNLLFYRQPNKTEWDSVRDYLVKLESEILTVWAINAQHILARVQYEDEELTTSADIVMDKALVQIQSGSSANELKRLELLVELFATAHLIRKAGYTIDTVVLFQPLSGLWMEMDVSAWSGDTLDAYLRSKLAVHNA
jgi:AAA domain/UvrD-like helicase C-terminal domain